MNDARPPRPHLTLLDDGRPLREVLSYTRRGSRFTPNQQESWDRHHQAWVIPDEATDAADFSFADWFGREAPMIVEIGPGVGEATGVLAAARPEVNVLALEVWVPGVADSMWRAADAGASNIRWCSVDAAWLLEHLIPTDSLAGLWTFFPDPWHKKKHNKRRLVNTEFSHMAAQRLAPGAEWRLATDWLPYAEQMLEVLDAEPLLEGGQVERWSERPVTKFERKGIEKGRDITDLRYLRR